MEILTKDQQQVWDILSDAPQHKTFSFDQRVYKLPQSRVDEIRRNVDEGWLEFKKRVNSGI